MPALGSVAGGGSWLLCEEMENGALWMGACLQSLEEPCEHSAWEPGRKSQRSSQLPMVVLKPKTATLHTHTHHSLHRPPPRTQTPVHLKVIGPHWHRSEHLRDPSSTLPAHPHMLPCQDHRSQCAHQHAPAQRENLLSSPTSLHMVMSAPVVAQEGLQWRQGLLWPALI